MDWDAWCDRWVRMEFSIAKKIETASPDYLWKRFRPLLLTVVRFVAEPIDQKTKAKGVKIEHLGYKLWVTRRGKFITHVSSRGRSHLTNVEIREAVRMVEMEAFFFNLLMSLARRLDVLNRQERRSAQRQECAEVVAQLALTAYSLFYKD